MTHHAISSTQFYFYQPQDGAAQRSTPGYYGALGYRLVRQMLKRSRSRDDTETLALIYFTIRLCTYM